MMEFFTIAFAIMFAWGIIGIIAVIVEILMDKSLG